MSAWGDPSLMTSGFWQISAFPRGKGFKKGKNSIILLSDFFLTEGKGMGYKFSFRNVFEMTEECSDGDG